MLKIEYKLLPKQWKYISDIFSNVGQAVFIFSLAAFFTPEAINLGKDFPKMLASVFIVSGLIIIGIGAIILRRGKT